MATTARSLLRSAAALRRGPATSSRYLLLPTRSLSSSGHHDDAYETAKWEKITYAGVAICTVLSIYHLSKEHPHHDEPPPYTYLHTRNKEFPWGPDGLFEQKH